MPALEGKGREGKKPRAVSKRPNKTAFSPTSAETNFLSPTSPKE